MRGIFRLRQCHGKESPGARHLDARHRADVRAARQRRGAAQEVVAIDWNFNGWGETAGAPRKARDRLAQAAAAVFGVPIVRAGFVAEGGALVGDGGGTMVTTRSCVLNPNRNPVRSGKTGERKIEADLARFGIRKTIWLNGDSCEPITSGHADGYVLFAPRGVVLVEDCDDRDIEPPLEHDISVLQAACDAGGRKLKVVHVRPPRRRYWNGDPKTFAPCYLNAYVANGAVITARFGDPERDEAARIQLARAFPRCQIMMLRIDTIANGGGGIHCLTQMMPMSRISELS